MHNERKKQKVLQRSVRSGDGGHYYTVRYHRDTADGFTKSILNQCIPFHFRLRLNMADCKK
ncbi:hypothetical protein LHV14_06030 [Limosilactobacillus reuteri]|nr:hypothetical protein [Limosilactobacillus reuteri]